jgi:hypothetical protein
MTQGYIPNQAIVKKAGIPRIEDAMGGLFSRGLSGAQDIISGLSNRADVNQLKSIQAAQSIIPNRNNVLDANDLFQSVSGRVSGQQARGLAQKENQLASQGLASKLSDKNKIVNRIASEEAKSIDSARLDLDRQGKEALTQFEKQLRDSNSFDDNEIQDALNSARKQIESKNKELVFGEAKKVTQFLDKTGGMNPIESASFKGNELTRAIGGQPSIQAQALPIAAKAAAIYQGGGAPLVRTAGQILSAPENLMKQVGYQPEKPGLLKYAGDYLQGVNQDVQESPQVQMLQNQNPIVAGGTGLTGESIPFMIAPEGALARNAAASTIKTLAKAGAPSIVKKIAGAAIKEGVQDAGLSALQTGSDLLSQVDSGALTKEQALSQLPSQLAINAAGDFVGAGALRGAGDLAGKALKGQIKLPEMPKTETVGGEGGANAVLERPTTAKPSNDFNMSETYRQIGQEMEKAGLLEQATKFYKKADANDPLLVNAKLKKQKGITQVRKRIAEEEANLQKSQQVAPDNNIPSQVDNLGNQAKPPTETESPKYKNSELDRPQTLAQDSNLRTNTQTQAQVEFAIRAKAGRIEQLNKRIKGNSLELANLKKGGKSWRGFTTKDIPALEKKIQEDKEALEKFKNSIIPVAQQVKASETSEIKLDEIIPKKPIIPDAPKTQNPIIPDAQTGKAGGQFKVDEILSEYGNKKGGIDAANKWLAENKDTEAVQQWVKENKFTNQKQLDTFLSKRHKEVRTPIEQARQARIQEGKLENMEEKARGVIAADKLNMAKQEARTQELIEIARGDVKDPEVQKVRTSLAKQGIEWRETPTSKQPSPVQTPRNQAELEQTYKTTFGLDEPKAKAAAVVTDRIFDTIARRKGITKEAAYAEVGFKKSNVSEVGKGAKFQGAQTDTPEFKNWFGDSKVVDESGKPLVVYHGTGADFNEFKEGATIKGRFFSSDSGEAGRFAKGGEKENIKPVFLSIKEPKIIDFENKVFDFKKINSFVVRAKSDGYDGVIIKNIKNFPDSRPSETHIAFEPTQIKSATGNSGKFDPKNPDIRFQNGKGAMETLESGKKVIHALTDPNVSTPLHEVAHVYEEVLTKSERNTILKWAGSKEWDTNASEKFARGFERYLSEGKAPIPALKEIFEDFKNWLVDIYKGITGSEIDLKLNKSMRKIYDDMLGRPDLKKIYNAESATKLDIDDLAKTATEPINDYEKVMAEAMLKADPRSFRSGKPPDVKDWTEFQQKYRNPENYNTLDKQVDTKLKPRQQNIINELASTQQVRTNLDKTVKKANRELTKLLEPNESVSIQVGKNTYTFTRKDTEIVLNAKGQAELQRALDDFNEGREPELKQSKDSLNVQVKNVEIETPRISQQTKEGLANFIVEKSLRYANVDKEYDALKVEFDNNFKPDELFGKVWTDKNSTATFHVSKGALRDSDFNEFKAATTKELKGSKAFTEEAELKYPKTVKEGRLPPTSTKRAQEAIKQRLDMAEVKKEGVNTVEDIEAISKEFEGVKEKVKKSAKGKSFADAGIIIAALKLATGDPVDAVLSGVRAFGGFNKLAEKTKSKGLYEAAELADAFLGMQRGIETRLMDIDHPAVKKFSDIYKKMAAQEFTIRGKMNSAIDAKLVNPDELELVKKFFQENSPETIDALFAQHGAIEGITNPAAYAYAEAINDIRRARKEVLGAITKSNALPDNAKKAFETLFALDDSVYGQVHSKVNAFINDTVYKTALAYRLSSIPTILTDVPMKTGTTQGFRNTIGAVGDFLSKNPKVVNSELFKSFKAERMGNSWNQELSILAKTSKNPVFRTLQELAGKIQNNPLLGDWFSNTASGTQNIGLIAIAKRFEQKYNKLNNTKIDIFKEYNGSNDVSREFALYANEQLNDLYSAGVGSLAKSGVSGNQLLKPLLFLKSESLRYQNLENKLMQQMKTGSEEVKREAFFAFTKYKMAQLLLGGTTAAGIGAASNLFLSYLTPEQQDNYKESMNYLNIGRLLNVDLTEKLNSAIIQRKPGQSFYEAAISTFDEMKNPIVQAVLKFPDAINNWEKAQKNGDIAGQIKALTAPLPYASGLGDLMAKAVRQYKGEFQPFYVQTAPRKIEQSAKEFEVSDYAGKSWKIHNAQEMADYERGAKELVMKIGVEKQGTLYKLTKDSAELNSYLNVLIKPKFYNDDPEMQKIANLPDGTPAKERVKNDIKAELLKSAYTSVNAKARTDAAKAPVSSPAYWANAKEDSIESTYKLFARSNPEKAKQIIKEAQKMASKNRKKVLARLTAN